MADLITVIGCGPGGPGALTHDACAAVEACSLLLGPARLLALFSEAARTETTGADVHATLDRLAELRVRERVGLLVSGDTGLYSLAANVVQRFGRKSVRLVPGLSSVQVALARLGASWQDARILSAHGRVPNEDPATLAGCEAVAILAGGTAGEAWIVRCIETLSVTHDAHLCIDLTLPGESVLAWRPELSARLREPRVVVVLLKKETA